MRNLKMTDIDEPLDYNELEEIVNTIVKKTIGRSLKDIETKILKGIYHGKIYPELAKKISHTEQNVKNITSSLFKILNTSKLLEETVNKSNLTSVIQRYKINSQSNYKRVKSTKLIIINGDITKLNAATFKAFIKSLQGKGQDVTIEIIDVEEGSIKITIQGTEEGLARIQELFDSENLETIEGFEILEVRDLDQKEQKRLEDKSIREVDLIGANLRGVDLIGADLRGAILSRAILRGAILSRAILSRAILRGANLSWAYLRGADLRGANLNEADLSWADLSWADLSEAILNKAILNEANLRGADLSEAILSWANLNKASVKDARFTNTKGINPEQKDSLIARGAIFDDYRNNLSEVLI